MITIEGFEWLAEPERPEPPSGELAEALASVTDLKFLKDLAADADAVHLALLINKGYLLETARAELARLPSRALVHARIRELETLS